MQQQPDMQQLMQLLQSETGRQLMGALRRSGSDARKAATLAAAGNMDEARQTLSGFLSDPEVQRLLVQLEGQL